MALSARQLTALKWYTDTYDLKVQLSRPPLMYFTDRKTKEEKTRDLSAIVTEYEDWNKEDQKRRASNKRKEKK